MKWLIRNSGTDDRRLVVQADWDGDFNEFIEQLKAGISEYLEETEDGRDLLSEYNKVFTWLHLYRNQNNLHLISILKEYKVNNLSIDCVRADIFADGCKTNDNLYEAEQY